MSERPPSAHRFAIELRTADGKFVKVARKDGAVTFVHETMSTPCQDGSVIAAFTITHEQARQLAGWLQPSVLGADK